MQRCESESQINSYVYEIWWHRRSNPSFAMWFIHNLEIQFCKLVIKVDLLSKEYVRHEYTSEMFLFVEKEHGIVIQQFLKIK